MSSLEDVLAHGEGVERPFRCHVHEDHSASASVNIAKGVWFCFACQAKGRTDGKKTAPSIAELQSMLEPERTPRIYPKAYLDLFHNELGVWPNRFEPWSRGLYELGCDPMTGDATFPVYTPKGRFAGVCRRNPDPEAKPRYRYPRDWSASRNLGFVKHKDGPRILVIVEGYADAVAVAETGISAAAVWGSGLHLPQVELIKRFNPKLVVLGFDADTAGWRGAERAELMLFGQFPVVHVNWATAISKDPAELDLETRFELLRGAVVGAGYPDPATEMLAATVAADIHYKEMIDERGL